MLKHSKSVKESIKKKKKTLHRKQKLVVSTEYIYIRESISHVFRLCASRQTKLVLGKSELCDELRVRRSRLQVCFRFYRCTEHRFLQQFLLINSYNSVKHK